MRSAEASCAEVGSEKLDMSPRTCGSELHVISLTRGVKHEHYAARRNNHRVPEHGAKLMQPEDAVATAADNTKHIGAPSSRVT